MEPEIKNEQQVLISNLPYLFQKPQINDIVAFENGKDILIKRIKKINNGKIFVLGDNLKDSLDSRNFGLISFNKILGKVIYKI